MTIRIFAIASVLAAVLAWGHAQAEIIKPDADLTPIQTVAGEITMLHSLTPMHNAHDVRMLSFFKRSGNGPATHIPFEAKVGYKPLLELQTGADCVYSSARVMRNGKSVRVVYATREGEWFDKKRVRFQLFDFRFNDQEISGTPLLYFALTKTVDTKKRYCDVNEALDQEKSLYMQGVK